MLHNLLKKVNPSREWESDILDLEIMGLVIPILRGDMTERTWKPVEKLLGTEVSCQLKSLLPAKPPSTPEKPKKEPTFRTCGPFSETRLRSFLVAGNNADVIFC